MNGVSSSVLFQPIKIGSLDLNNRIVMSPMTRERSPGGVPGLDIAEYYQRRAVGGAGLIVTEGTGIGHVAAVDHPDVPRLHGPDAIKGWENVVRHVHAAGGRIFPQLWHQGVLRNPFRAADPDVEPMRPSGIWGNPGLISYDRDYVEAVRAPTRPMTVREIDDVVLAYGDAALSAKQIGFDGVALHGAHGYLIDTFLWAETNLRQDRYGGDATGRTRFATEVISCIRSKVGSDFPIMFRFSQHKMQDYRAQLASTPTALAELLCPLADAGVDIFDASTRRFDQPAFPGSDLSLAGWAKKLTGRPAMAVGSIGLVPDNHRDQLGAAVEDNLPKVLKCLEEGEFDLVGVGRAILNDPNWPKRIREGQPGLPFERASLDKLT